MRKKIALLGTSLALAFPLASVAQNTLRLNEDAAKSTHIATSTDTLFVSYNEGVTPLAVMSNATFTAEALDADGRTPATWFRVAGSQPDRVVIAQDYSYSLNSRDGILRLTAGDGTVRDIPVVQQSNNAAATLQGDFRLTVTGEASQSQPGEGIERTYDGNTSTLYHSPYSGTSFPVTLTYTLSGSDRHVDYIIYTPRTDSNTNGNFGAFTVEYTTTDASGVWKKLGDYDFGASGSAARIDFGENGTDNVAKVRFTVNSGGGNFVSCAEMGFYALNDENNAAMDALFADRLCTTLKPGITADDINRCGNAYFRQLGLSLLNDGYTDWQKKFRIGEFDCYETISTLRTRLKTSTYNAYENPTGIHFVAGKPVVVFVDGMADVHATLIVHDFSNFGGNNDSQYPLANGINVITPTTTGNGYISYYAAPGLFEQAPKLKIHFALADVNGYFDLGRGDTNDDWRTLLLGACSDIIDVRTPRMQVAFPTTVFRQRCPNNGVELAQIYDDVIRLERQVMGLVLFGEEPKNRQFARIVSSGMFADGIGAGAADVSGWATPSRANFDFWGFGHELGHVNQIRPSFNWTGLGETTNNIYSAWVQFSLSEAPALRLESEVQPVFDSNNVQMFQGTGGRFNCYLQQNVCEGVTWQFANGGDYRYAETTDYTVTDEDEDGNRIAGATFTGPRRNYDHFVKVAPLWQLQLYGTQAGFAPDLYGKVLKGLRGTTDTNSAGQNMTNGQQLMRFVRTVCDSTRLNFLPFFEKAGMFGVVKRIIEDYTPGLLNVSEKMLGEVRSHVEEAGYPLPEGEVNYISGLNWAMYKNRAALVGGEVNEGCSRNGNTVIVSHDVWKNAVAFETYDANGEMIAISMYGLGHSSDRHHIDQTTVLFPAGAVEVKAVGWDGQRAICYRD